MRSLALVFITLFCISCPYTKVEESFNLQATHDILHYGSDIANYDHVEFPGVVPRTFIGSLVLGAITKMILFVMPSDLQLVVNEQLIVRLVLGTIVAAALTRFQTAVGKLFGSGASTAFALLTCCQFHILFWSSRTLPNTLALPLVLMGMAAWIESLAVQQQQRVQHLQRMIWYLAPAGIIFRFEAGILLAILVMIEWIGYHNLPLTALLKHGILSVILSLVLTILVDSFFWQRWLWPEGEVFYFNAILNKSSEWGTMPFYAYFLLFLPRILMVSYPLALLAYCRDATVRRLLMPSLIYIGLFSCLPHKEWRFIIYTIPVWTAAAAASVVGWMRSRLGLALVLSGGLASIVGSVVMLSISMQNYPGGEALARLHLLEPSTQPLHVHLDVPTAMTGASRFGELFRPVWRYSKDESHKSADDYIEAEYTHLITSHPEMHNDHFIVVDEIRGLDSVRLKTPKTYIQDLRQFISNRHLDAILPLNIVTAPKLFIMKLRGHPQTQWVHHTIEKYPMVLYSKTYCPFCRRAKQILNIHCRNYKVIEVDLRPDDIAMKEALFTISGRRTFPNLFLHGKSIGGSDDIVLLQSQGRLAEILPC
ncbi:hypothetical protein O0I10_009863 [Lichtheimia ornata]|uniref:Mannosyltransferase n=1 Tax=Lichtheimia ornata TaxID=688661 RepID=A0AAD7UXD7_9FUNG|nr:uncharacterized protein O0I10_009863 [Lichtheimia ornata]KAJ8654422.1 hypothetical protein O0I10_009863 [Lichtheimia ornata]